MVNFLMNSEESVFGIEIARKDVEMITFSNDLNHLPKNVYDASLKQNGSILSYIKDKHLYIASAEVIYAPINSHGLFKGFSQLRWLKFNDCFRVDYVSDMSSMFEGCMNLLNLDLSFFNTQKVETMKGMFKQCSTLLELDVSRLDTSLVYDMSGMFESMYGIERLDLSSFDTSRCEDMSDLFSGCFDLKELIIPFDTRNVRYMESMFYQCRTLESIDLSSFDTINVQTMAFMFARCLKLKHLHLSSFNTENVTSMEKMFFHCHELSSLDVSSFNTSRVYNVSHMFDFCNALEDFDVSGFDLSKAIYKDFFYRKDKQQVVL